MNEEQPQPKPFNKQETIHALVKEKQETLEKITFHKEMLEKELEYLLPMKELIYEKTV